jgi:hypothetical protein
MPVVPRISYSTYLGLPRRIGHRRFAAATKRTPQSDSWSPSQGFGLIISEASRSGFGNGSGRDCEWPIRAIPGGRFDNTLGQVMPTFSIVRFANSTTSCPCTSKTCVSISRRIGQRKQRLAHRMHPSVASLEQQKLLARRRPSSSRWPRACSVDSIGPGFVPSEMRVCLYWAIIKALLDSGSPVLARKPMEPTPERSLP